VKSILFYYSFSALFAGTRKFVAHGEGYEGALGEVRAMLPRLSPAERLVLRSRLDDLERLPEIR